MNSHIKSDMDHDTHSALTIRKLIALIGSRDPNERRTAQERLTGIGKGAVPALILLTASPEAELRREGAALLGDIGDRSAIPALINLLVDEAFEVRWRAAESLIKMRRESIIPLFRALWQSDRFDSVWFLEGIHHILRKLNEEGYLAPPSQQVLAAFDDPVREIAIPAAARKALEALDKSE